MSPVRRETSTERKTAVIDKEPEFFLFIASVGISKVYDRSHDVTKFVSAVGADTLAIHAFLLVWGCAGWVGDFGL